MDNKNEMKNIKRNTIRMKKKNLSQSKSFVRGVCVCVCVCKCRCVMFIHCMLDINEFFFLV